MPEDWEAGGFGIYIHWPFCEAKCPYCDFNSHVSRSIDQDRWLSAYLSELDRQAAEVPGRVVSSVFFGGGTPSLMDPHVVGAVLDRIARLWPQANDPEITLEANPGSVESSRFRAYHSAGVSRVSMGFQAMNDGDLRRLGRLHTVAEALRAFDIARSCFERVSFDLIYARQDQTPEDWQKELEQALELAVDHLSLYQLTIEEGTAFGDRYRIGKLRGLPDEDAAATMYEITQAVTAAAGFEPYEVSNHARPGAESRHNSLYWRYGDYVGIGPGAHGRLTLGGKRNATEAIRMPDGWLKAAEQGNGDKRRTPLSPSDQATEFLLMGLRLTEGVDMMRYTRLAGRPLSQSSVLDLSEMGMIETDGQRLRVSPQGRLVLNAVIARLLE
ncbi:coproporphyrinogen III oxidase [Pseudooceanicola batsensis HTCC2597]|uniref:Heme chaperone HemW n=1 Tax=Pseudooceanicola batsensis (strain ATCC BAA-863 / DSM 15984 / KCTC 12145 / HTCC2597) TaxID=252305 RepID=A3TXT4_PSEBH|nr:radical SAM family heme chaperone HemW [Pseudooceanicola batsensis]EAQ02968.1 coproporphyrinogen III oxidase [Pseudooceanicola batsensis HTCC2597]